MFDLEIEEDSRGVIEKLISIHKDNVPPLALIQPFYEPSFGSTRDLSSGDHENVVSQDLSAYLGIKYWMIDRHPHLI
jgi:hypothetical protein